LLRSWLCWRRKHVGEWIAQLQQIIERILGLRLNRRWIGRSKQIHNVAG